MLLILSLFVGCTETEGSDSSRPRYETEEETGADTTETTEHTDTEVPETGDTDTSNEPTELTKPKGITRVVLVVKDTTRWDVCQPSSVSQGTEVVMPFLCSLIENGGVNMTQAWGSGNWTRPTVPAIVTGVPGFSLGADTYRDDSVPQIPDEVPTLGERFAGAGWATRADLCNSVARDGEGTRGFDSVEVCASPESNSTTALQQFERSAAWLSDADDNAFLWLQFMESHDPFNRPHAECKDAAWEATQACPGWTGMIEGNGGWWDRNDATTETACKAAIVAAYECDTRQLDADIEEGFTLLNSMDLLEGTAVFFTADHGEHFLEPHGSGMDEVLAHHRHMYAQVSRVPATMWWKNANPITVTLPVGQPNVAPTLLDIAGLDHEDGIIEGTSIFTLANDDTATSRIVTQFACDSGGSWHGAAYQMEGVAYHTIAYHSYERPNDPDEWTTYNATKDPDETTPLGGYTIPEEIRETLQYQIDTSIDWHCS